DGHDAHALRHDGGRGVRPLPEHAHHDPRGRRRLAPVDVRALRGAPRGLRELEGARVEDAADGDLRAPDAGDGRGVRGDRPEDRPRVPARRPRRARLRLAALRRDAGPPERLPQGERRARRGRRPDGGDGDARALVPLSDPRPCLGSGSAEARKTAVPVRSSGWSARRSALNMTSALAISSGTIFLVASVMVTPGAIAFTLMPHGPRAPAMYLVRPAMPILATL